MPRGGTRRAFTEADKAVILTTLAANGGFVKPTARDTGASPASIRRWRDEAARGNGPSSQAITKAVGEFADRAQSIRDKALGALEALIDEGKLGGAQLITAIGVLDDKVTRAKGLPTSHTQITAAQLPDRDQLRELMAGVVSGAIEAAERRHDEIVDAEIVAEIPLTTT